MPATLFDNTISSEELLDVRRSLMEIIGFFQNKSLPNAIENENIVYVPIRAQLEDYKTDNQSFSSTLDNYQNFTLDHLEKGKDLNNISNFSETRNVSGNFSVSPELYDEIKKDTDSYMKALGPPPSTVKDSILEDFDQAVSDFSIQIETEPRPTVSIAGITGADSGISNNPEYAGTFKNKLLQECIPCAARALSIEAVNPIDGLIALIQSEIDKVNALLDKLKNLLFNNDITLDICQLSRFFESMCVPDLASMIAVLGLLFLKYVDLFKINFNSTISLITPLFSPILSGLSGLLDQYLQLIIAPIECIIESLDSILIKLLPTEIPGPESLDDLRKTTSEIRLTIGSGLQDIQKYLISGRDFAQQKLALVLDEVNKFLDSKSRGLVVSIEVASDLQKIARLVGIIRFILQLKSKGVELCNSGADPQSVIGSFFAELNRDSSLGPAQARVVLAQEIEKKVGTSPYKDGDPNDVSPSLKLIIAPPGSVLSAKSKDSSGSSAKNRDPEFFISADDIKKYNLSGILPNIGDLASVDITAIIPDTGLRLSPTIVPFDLCKNSGSPASLDKLKNWMTSLNT
jgi:uncharacterized small protein (DUF1192 family)